MEQCLLSPKVVEKMIHKYYQSQNIFDHDSNCFDLAAVENVKQLFYDSMELTQVYRQLSDYPMLRSTRLILHSAMVSSYDCCKKIWCFIGEFCKEVEFCVEHIGQNKYRFPSFHVGIRFLSQQVSELTERLLPLIQTGQRKSDANLLQALMLLYEQGNHMSYLAQRAVQHRNL